MDSPAEMQRFQNARAAYPGVIVAEDAFAAHVASKLVDGVTNEALRVDDLFLAFAAGSGDRTAIALIEQETFGEIEAAYRRFRGIGASLDDVLQRIRVKLFVSDPPAILGYSGKGSLRGWVRASALHLLINITQRETREEPTDAALFDVLVDTTRGADAIYAKLATRAELTIAVATAMRGLDAREKTLLRYAYVDGRNVDEIGAVYAVHRATAARWVAAAREQLVERTLGDLVSRLRISRSEAHSMVASSSTGIGSILLANLS